MEMQMPLLNKHLYLMLLASEGKKLDLAHFSIQDLIFKNDNEYEVTCLAADNKNTKTHEKRRGKYSVKQKGDNEWVFLCDEQTGQLAGKYEITFHWINGKIGEVHSLSLDDKSAVNGIFRIAV